MELRSGPELRPAPSSFPDSGARLSVTDKLGSLAAMTPAPDVTLCPAAVGAALRLGEGGVKRETLPLKGGARATLRERGGGDPQPTSASKAPGAAGSGRPGWLLYGELGARASGS